MAKEQAQNKQCPNCGYEYESWVKNCPDCGTPLEARPKLRVIKGQLDPNTDPRWTMVTNVPNAIIGSFMKSQIEDAGIPVLMFRSRSADIAEFSHNDYVPQDLLVPLDRFHEARRLIDSAPGNDYGPRLWGVDTEDYEDEDEEGDSEQPDENETPKQNSNLPEGWAMLPTEADLSARQQVRRTHGDSLRGWYWADEKQQGAQRDAKHGPFYDEDPYDYDAEQRYPDLIRRRDPGPYGSPDYAGDNYGKTNWVRIGYGILLLAMTLPFILQVLGEIWSMFGR